MTTPRIESFNMPCRKFVFPLDPAKTAFQMLKAHAQKKLPFWDPLFTCAVRYTSASFDAKVFDPNSAGSVAPKIQDITAKAALWSGFTASNPGKCTCLCGPSFNITRFHPTASLKFRSKLNPSKRGLSYNQPTSRSPPPSATWDA